MKSSIKIASILLTAGALSLVMLTEVKPAKSQSAPPPNTQQQSTQSIPEPGTIVGLLVTILGGLFVKKQLAETETPELPKDSTVENTEINSEDNSDKN